jgi:hypothetical protein
MEADESDVDYAAFFNAAMHDSRGSTTVLGIIASPA